MLALLTVLYPDVRALFVQRFGVEEIVYHGEDGIALFHQRKVCGVRQNGQPGFRARSQVAKNLIALESEHFSHDGWVKEALDDFPQLTADALKGLPFETEYKKLSPTPNEFPNFVKRVIAMDLKQ